MEPAARAVDFLADELGQNQKDDAERVQRQRAPSDPAVINQAREHESEKSAQDPVRLLARKLCPPWILAPISRPCASTSAEDRQPKPADESDPVHPHRLTRKS